MGSKNKDCEYDSIIIANYDNLKLDVHLNYLKGNVVKKNEQVIFKQRADIEEFCKKLREIKCKSIISRRRERDIFIFLFAAVKHPFPENWFILCDIYRRVTFFDWKNEFDACELLGINIMNTMGKDRNSQTTCDMLCGIYLKLKIIESINIKKPKKQIQYGPAMLLNPKVKR